jgi:hypothetical protein
MSLLLAGAVLEQILGQLVHRNAEMLPGADEVHKLQVHDLDLVFLGEFQYFPNVHPLLLSGSRVNG